MGASVAILNQFRYSILVIVQLASIALLLAGGAWLYLIPVLLVTMATVVDEILGDMGSDPDLNPVLMNTFLVASLPLVFVISLLVACYLGASAALDGFIGLFGVDFANARASTSGMELTAAIIGVGLLFGAAAVNVAHELIHRKNAQLYVTGRWLLAFSFDTTFAIEHVYGHHRYVGTLKDPATARRGETSYGFIIRSTIGQFASAFRIEAERLKRKNLPLIGFQNRAIRGQFMTLGLLVLHYMIAGWWGVLAFTIVGLQAKFYLELVNYVEHYGLVREEGRRVEPRHSWNCDRWMSNLLLFNLPRHSHHHQYATKPFWELQSLEDAPRLPFGYKTMMVAALVPPVWTRVLDPLLEKWDAGLATDAERRIVHERTRSPEPSAA